MRNSLPNIIVLSILTLSISFVQTAIGYKPILGSGLTWVVSFIITLLMFNSQMQLRSRLRSKQSVWGLLLFYLFIALISFGGNFNAFYSRSMKKELYSNELKQLETEIPALANKARTALRSSTNFSATESKLRSIVSSLKLQIKDPADPGIGRRARSLIAEFKEISKRPVTTLNPNWSKGTRTAVYNDLAERMAEQLNQHLADMKIDENSDIEPAIQKIKESESLAMPAISLALRDDNVLSNGNSAIKDAVRAYNQICNTTSQVLSSFDCEAKIEKNTSVGDLTHTYNSAFIRMANPSATFLNTFLSLFIDFLVPIFIFLTVQTNSGPNNGENNSNNQQGRTYIKREDKISKIIDKVNPQPNKAKRL